MFDWLADIEYVGEDETLTWSVRVEAARVISTLANGKLFGTNVSTWSKMIDHFFRVPLCNFKTRPKSCPRRSVTLNHEPPTEPVQRARCGTIYRSQVRRRFMLGHYWPS